MSGSWYFLVVKRAVWCLFGLDVHTTSPHHDSTESLLFYMSLSRAAWREVQRKGHILGGQLAPKRKLHLLPFYAILFEKRCLRIFSASSSTSEKNHIPQTNMSVESLKDSEVLIVSKVIVKH